MVAYHDSLAQKRFAAFGTAEIVRGTGMRMSRKVAIVADEVSFAICTNMISGTCMRCIPDQVSDQEQRDQGDRKYGAKCFHTASLAQHRARFNYPTRAAGGLPLGQNLQERWRLSNTG
jgi:hypothetical protein